MKSTSAKILLLLIVSGIYSCTKFKENRSNAPATDHTIAQSSVHDLFLQGYFSAVFANGLAQNIEGCSSFSKDGNDYPMNITIDFGAENCDGRYNVRRRGSLQVFIDKDFRENGSKITVNSQNFVVNDYAINGSLIISRNGTSAEDNPIFGVTASELKISSGESFEYSWSTDRTYELIEGKKDLNFVWDDIFTVRGTSSGTDRDGAVYTAEITDESLTYPLNCRWPSGGKESLNTEDRDEREINYGSGEGCDNKAEIKRNKKSKTLDMR